MVRNAARRALVTLATAAATIVPLVGLSAGTAHAAGTDSLLILPDQGETAIYNFINSATSSIDMTMYELRDTTVTTDLVNREKAGVNVRVILDGKETSVNNAAFNALQAGGVSVTFSSTAFTFTHQKTITVDNKESFISTGNLDTMFYSTSRDYGIFDTDPADVAAVVQVFNADFAKTAITPSDGDDLVWSPTDSQTQLLALINGAQHSLDIEQEEFSDTALVNAIVAAENRGVKVRVVVEDPSSYTTELNEITAAGGTFKGYSDPNGFYIHAKAIVADFGFPTAKVFAGSENFSANSLNDNRELGMIITDPGVMDGIETTFTDDFNGVTSTGSVTVASPGSQASTVGTAASLQVSATDTAGGTLSYSATGLPAGLSIKSATGLISGTPTTAGTSSVTVTATDSTGPSGSATFSWTVGAASSCTAAQLLGNPGFETGAAAPWAATTGVIADKAAEPARTGSWDAWLDGYGTTHTDTLSQAVTVPAGCASYNLSFWLHIDTAETSTTTAFDTLKVQVLNSAGTVLATLATFSNLNHSTGYAQHTFSLAPYAGQAITLKFTGAEDSVDQTSFVIDDTAINVS